MARSQSPAIACRGRRPRSRRRRRHWKRLKEWHKSLYQGGWIGLTWPKEYGGRGATFIEQVIFQQELGRLNLPIGCNVLGVIMTGPALMQWGTDEQKKRYLEPILSGDEIWCEGMSEPGAGSDLAVIQTRAVLDGDNFVVNGQKVWTTIAHRADFCQLFVRTDPDLPKHKGMSALLVDMKAPGVIVSPLKQITGDAEFNEIFFEDVRVPKENLLGPVNMGWQVLVSTLMHERIGIGETLGGTEQVLACTRRARQAVQVNGRPAIEDHDDPPANRAVRERSRRQEIQRHAQPDQAAQGSAARRRSVDLQDGLDRLGAADDQVITRLLGEYALLERRSPFAPDGDWMRRILAANR